MALDDGPWKAPSVAQWCHTLLDSYRRWTGCELIHRAEGREWPIETLFFAPLVIVSHGNEPDPLLNYGNRMALQLWDMTWDEFVGTPSRLTAEPTDRAERRQMLQRAETMGYISDYRGVRVTKSGRRFLIERATIWNVVDTEGARLGQAAAFSQWRFL